MKHAVVGIDPGNTTGCFAAMIYVYDDGPTWSLTSHHEFGSASEVRDWLANFIVNVAETTNLVVGMERFTISTRTARLTRQPAAIEIIGVVKEVCEALGVTCRMQMKSEVVRLGSDAKLRKLKWYSPGEGHANDAARHALMALAHHDEKIFAALVTQVV